MNSKKVIDFLLIVGLFLLVYIFFFRHLDLIADLPRNICSTGAFNLKMNQARAAGESLASVTDYFYKRWSYMGGIFYPGMAEWYALSIPLSQLVLTVAFKFLFPSPEAIIITCSLISLLTIILTYFLGRRMFGRWVGILAATLMASSLFIIIPSRIGYIFFSLEALSGVLAGLFLFGAFSSKSRRRLLVSSFFLALGAFNGHTAFIFSMPLFFAAMALSDLRLKKQKIFSLKDYFLAAIMALFFYFTLRFAYAIFFNGSPLLSLKWAYLGFMDRQSQIPNPFNKDRFFIDNFWLNNFERLVRLMFAQAQFNRVTTDAWYLSLPGKTLLYPLAAAGFLGGVVSLLRRRDFRSKFLLLWILIPLATFTLFIHFDARYIMSAAAAIFIISALGWVRVMEFLLARLSKIFWAKALILILFLLGLGKSIQIVNDNLYHSYIAQYDGVLLREMGLVQSGNFIREHSRPESTLVVLGDRESVLENCVDFGTGIQNYPYVFWSDLLAQEKDLALWEREVLKQKEKIFYVFSRGLNLLEMPGRNVYPWVADWNLFYSLHPGLSPAKEIKFSTGVPAMVVYEVTRDLAAKSPAPVDLKKMQTWRSGKNSSFKEPLALRLVGPLEDLAIRVSQDNFTWPLNFFKGQELVVSYRSEDLFIQKLVADYGAEQFFKSQNVLLDSGEEGRASLLNDGQGEFIIKIDAPGKIKEVEVITNSLFFNDQEGVNAVGGAYSLYNSYYQSFFEIRSDRSKVWKEKATYHLLHPNSKTVYFKFSLSGQGKKVSFLLNQSRPPLIRAKVDTTDLRKIFVPPSGGEIIFQTKAKKPGEVYLLIPK